LTFFVALLRYRYRFCGGREEDAARTASAALVETSGHDVDGFHLRVIAPKRFFGITRDDDETNSTQSRYRVPASSPSEQPVANVLDLLGLLSVGTRKNANWQRSRRTRPYGSSPRARRQMDVGTKDSRWLLVAVILWSGAQDCGRPDKVSACTTLDQR